MEKIFIKNRRDQKLAIVIDKADNQIGLAFVMHGLGDSKDSEHIKMYAKCFLDNGYTVVRFDTTNTFGESDGKFEDANITSYFEDLEDVINWSKGQIFYCEPFILCGHSLGAICSAFYAENNPGKVLALAPFSSVINVETSRENYSAQELLDWERTGWLEEDWGDFKVKLKWSYLKEKEKYDLLLKANELIMPVLMMVGSLDDVTQPKNQKLLFNMLPSKKELHIIEGAPHTFRESRHLEEAGNIINIWIKSLLS